MHPSLNPLSHYNQMQNNESKIYKFYFCATISFVAL